MDSTNLYIKGQNTAILTSIVVSMFICCCSVVDPTIYTTKLTTTSLSVVTGVLFVSTLGVILQSPTITK